MYFFYEYYAVIYIDSMKLHALLFLWNIVYTFKLEIKLNIYVVVSSNLLFKINS